MDEKVILQALVEQQEDLVQHRNKHWCHRIEEDQFEWDSNLIQVVIGVRRSGKTTLCHKVLLQNGIKYAYANFDDDRLTNLGTSDLNMLLECLYQIYGTDVNYMFFDEIQEIEGWQLFVNRLQRSGVHIFLTGSNARLLSSELSTYLTGRYNEIRLYPFSFEERCEFLNVNTQGITTKAIAELKSAANDYLSEGGLPEILNIKRQQTRQTYVEGLLEAIVAKDIAKRFNIKNVEGLRRIAHHLINNSCQEINYNTLAELAQLKSTNTAQRYVSYLTQAFLIHRLQKFSFKSKERICNTKSYVIDTGFISNRENVLLNENAGWRLENAVCIELMRRHRTSADDIYYFKPTTQGHEVDFVVCRQGVVQELIQVAYSISETKTYKREVNALVLSAEKLHCENLSLITFGESRLTTEKGHLINIYSAIDWLLKKSPR